MCIIGRLFTGHHLLQGTGASQQQTHNPPWSVSRLTGPLWGDALPFGLSEYLLGFAQFFPWWKEIYCKRLLFTEKEALAAQFFVYSSWWKSKVTSLGWKECGTVQTQTTCSSCLSLLQLTRTVRCWFQICTKIYFLNQNWNSKKTVDVSLSSEPCFPVLHSLLLLLRLFSCCFFFPLTEQTFSQTSGL